MRYSMGPERDTTLFHLYSKTYQTREIPSGIQDSGEHRNVVKKIKEHIAHCAELQESLAKFYANNQNH